jgi:hypothetical protein
VLWYWLKKKLRVVWKLFLHSTKLTRKRRNKLIPCAGSFEKLL